MSPAEPQRTPPSDFERELIEDSPPPSADITPLVDRIKRNDAGDQELRRASANINQLISDLPATDDLLVEEHALAAWRTLREKHPRLYRIYLGRIRSVWAHRGLTDVIEGLVASPAPGEARELHMLTVDDLLAQPAPTWLNDQRLPERGLAVMYGESQSGKTFLALDAALAVARGAPWFGRDCRAGGVIYVAAEGRLRDRVDAYKRHHNLCANDFAGLRIIEESADLSGPTRDVQRLTERIAEATDAIGSVALVVIDTVARVMPGADENSGKDMGGFIAAARRIEDACGGLVLCVHHSGKDSTKGARGHSSLRCATELEIEVTRDEQSGIRTAKIAKLRDGPDGEILSFRLECVPLSETRGSCVVASSEAAPQRRQERALSGAATIALKALQEAVGEYGKLMPGTSTIPAGVRAVTVGQWRTRFDIRYGRDPDAGARDAEAVRKAFMRAREALVGASLVGVSDTYAWASK